jgi:hypothetical protein
LTPELKAWCDIKKVAICKASINLHVATDICTWLLAFLAAHYRVTIRQFKRKIVYAGLYFVTLVLIPSYKKCQH